MRRTLGSLLKAMSFVILILFVSIGIMIASQLPQYSIPPHYQVMVYISVGIIGLLLFLLVYACGQSVQALVRLWELQTASYNSLREIVIFLHERATPNPFSKNYDPLRTCESLFDEPSSNWRRSPPPLEEEFQPVAAPASQEAFPQIYCSLCGTIQNAGHRACVHCGASFEEELTA